MDALPKSYSVYLSTDLRKWKELGELEMIAIVGAINIDIWMKEKKRWDRKQSNKLTDLEIPFVPFLI